MIQNFLDSRLLTVIIVLLLLLSIICQIMIGVLYQTLIKETDNMAATGNRLLKQCKLKFANCYQLNMGVVNVPVFVDKFINKIQLAGITMAGIGHLSGQLMLLSVLISGIGVCKGIIDGRTIGSLLPYYIVSFFGLYLYFSASSLIDVNGKKRVLKTNLVDYLENHMVNHLSMAGSMETERAPKIKGEKLPVTETAENRTIFGKSEEQELEELLREFLA